MDTFVISWRPSNFVTIGLMVVAWVAIYTVVSQVGRRVAAKVSQ